VGGGEPSPWSVADGGQGNPAECDATVWYQVGGGVSLLLEVGIFFNYADIMMDDRSFPRLRPSVSHAASRRAEIDRIRRMTVEERVKAALGLAARFAALRPAPRKA
jgi:hypothetical protein